MQTDPVVDAKALRDARVEAGITQHELARLVGVAGGERVSRWERGVSVPRAEVLHRIADVLNVSSVDLLVPVAGDPDLRRLRVLAGLSAKQVAEQTHISIATYARWESGQLGGMPSGVALEALARALGSGAGEVRAALVAARRAGE